MATQDVTTSATGAASATTMRRRDEVRPGDVIRSSHGYRLFVTEVIDDAPARTDERHVEFRGTIHSPTGPFRNERYQASLLVPVEVAPASATTPTPVPPPPVVPGGQRYSRAQHCMVESAREFDAMTDAWSADDIAAYVAECAAQTSEDHARIAAQCRAAHGRYAVPAMTLTELTIIECGVSPDEAATLAAGGAW